MNHSNFYLRRIPAHKREAHAQYQADFAAKVAARQADEDDGSEPGPSYVDPDWDQREPARLPELRSTVIPRCSVCGRGFDTGECRCPDY